MSRSDIDYYRDRANTERSMVLISENPSVAAIHEKLAQLYQTLVDEEEAQPMLRIVSEARL